MLLLKEGKKVVFSLIFLIFLAGFWIFLNSQGVWQFTEADKILEPREGGSYGTKAVEIPELVMPAALASLYAEFSANEYTAYPIGFYKNVRLNEKDRQEMARILSALSGIPAEIIYQSEKPSDSGKEQFQIGQDIQVQGDGNVSISVSGQENGEQEITELPEVALDETISYEEFREYMRQADALIGGGSKYAEKELKSFGQVPVTYEEAAASYELAKNSDRFTGAYARLFSDYTVVMMGLLPVFPAIALCLKDRRKNVVELIYTRQISSARLILARYTALLLAVMLPVILFAYISNSSAWGLHSGEKLDYLMPLLYSAGWVMPTVMMALAVGMFLTELTGTPVAAAVQGLWWFVDINMGAVVNMSNGDFELLRLMPRHNNLMHGDVFLENFRRLVNNRLLFAGVAVMLTGATILVHQYKRGGKLHGNDIIRQWFSGMAYRQGQPEA